jgi:hypothetical protein
MIGPMPNEDEQFLTPLELAYKPIKDRTCNSKTGDSLLYKYYSKKSNIQDNRNKKVNYEKMKNIVKPKNKATVQKRD